MVIMKSIKLGVPIFQQLIMTSLEPIIFAQALC